MAYVARDNTKLEVRTRQEVAPEVTPTELDRLYDRFTRSAHPIGRHNPARTERRGVPVRLFGE